MSSDPPMVMKCDPLETGLVEQPGDLLGPTPL
jgi:hypothetical protein